MLYMLQGVLRHLLTFGGGFLIEEGLLSGDDAQTLVASVITIFGLGWSMIDKKKRTVNN